MNEALLRQLVLQRPCGLLTDIDGTISPIASTPEAAQVTSDARRELQHLAQRLDLVAAISGRAATDAAALVGLPELIYIGNHGLEIWQAGQAAPVPEAAEYAATINDLLTRARECMARQDIDQSRIAQVQITPPGILFENKGVTASIHYRLADNPAQAEAVLGALLQELAVQHGLVLTPGRMVWEIRPPLAINKGTATRRLIQQHRLHSAIFIGDDRTDADAFRVLRELRDHGDCATLSVGVAAPETPPIVRELADVMVDGVAGVEAFLAQLNAIVAA
jgi:trehalose 6-phosphate phosphatase